MKITEFSILTIIDAPIERCFNLSRSIDLHLDSMVNSREKAAAGITSGLIGLGDTVTWRAWHFWQWQEFTSKIVEFSPPSLFTEEMQKGAFKRFWHEHRFTENASGTAMTDSIMYEVPFGIFGKVFDTLVLRRYMRQLIESRNQVIKEAAEGNTWQKYI